MRQLLLIIVILLGGIAYSEPIRVVSYNVENLFHPAKDSINGQAQNDTEWTLEGERRWSFTRYNRKTENIARVITNIGQWSGVDIIGLCEIENAECLRRLSQVMRRDKYDFVHYESPDPRGIDVALLYKRERIDTISTKAIRMPFPTRDILYVSAQVDKKDTLHLFICHLPSQLGGKAKSEWKRIAAKEILQKEVDSILYTNTNAHIIIMGDMNTKAIQDIKGLINKMMTLQADNQGTHKHQGQWTCLDQFYCSPAVDSISEVSVYNTEWIMENDDKYLGLKPKRTYIGFHYQNGFSDHLPIVMDINYKNL
ncbi:MAG: hypothetical protein UH084_06010 [Paludibacteraceae bacterium]|nr:hypothetical protein [Paludibacteraceae bacterium]